MFAHTACRFFLFLFLSLSANAKPKEESVDLLTAVDYVILAKSGISNVPGSDIIGDIGVSPIAGTAMTGFDFTMDDSGEFATSSEMEGSKAFAADYADPVPTHLATAVSSMEAAYTDAAGRPNPDAARINYGGGVLGGDFGGESTPLTPGVYTFDTGVTIVGDLYFEGTGFRRGEGNSDVWIIQVAGNLLEDTNTNVVLTLGAAALNINWQVAGNVNVMAGAHMEGVLLAKTDVTFETGSSISGRVLSQTACNLQMASIIEPPRGRGQRGASRSARLDVEPNSAGVVLRTSFLGLFAMILAIALF
jgi:hypothetical protein